MVLKYVVKNKILNTFFFLFRYSILEISAKIFLIQCTFNFRYNVRNKFLKPNENKCKISIL